MHRKEAAALGFIELYPVKRTEKNKIFWNCKKLKK